MINNNASKWQIGDVVARLDLGVVLEIDNFELDTGEYFVLVGLWDENDQEYQIIEHSSVSVSGPEIEAFVASGVIPRAVDLLVNRFGA